MKARLLKKIRRRFCIEYFPDGYNDVYSKRCLVLFDSKFPMGIGDLILEANQEMNREQFISEGKEKLLESILHRTYVANPELGAKRRKRERKKHIWP